LRRLFSTFAHGRPGLGLLLLRVAAAAALLRQALSGLPAGAHIAACAQPAVAIGGGILLLAGLWTPITASLVAVLEVWSTISHPADPWASILLGAIGVALALLGPGAWSIDARLFGWRRIDVQNG